jgi:hypothetical protein
MVVGGFNLPPGVSVNDIPGNRPEDLREEAFWDKVDAKFIEEVGEVEAESALGIWATNLRLGELFTKYVNIARYIEGQEAFDQGKLEAEMTENEIQNAMVEYGFLSENEISAYLGARREVLKKWNSKD